ncbi:hypothetical protein Slin15195_G028670 [Septoria linicola]|uniref:Uncharacterized protein n=1 Tax=Septoria linicola TaxID=215465 RepID=A0A9Q9EHQ6_9PEZI|nr:hypothetical protein Slin14017_G027710 [Septoria linicola]USW49548.1 hypothetical protein Slin15195_G028670 [Septoria linicola]
MGEDGAGAGVSELRAKKRVAFATENDEITFDAEQPVAAPARDNDQAQLESANSKAESGEDVEMRDASLASAPIPHTPTATHRMAARHPPPVFPMSGMTPHPFEPQLRLPTWQQIAQVQTQPIFWTPPTIQRHPPHPPQLSGPSNIYQVPTVINPMPALPQAPSPFPTPASAPRLPARSKRSEINKLLDNRNGQVSDLLDWLTNEARIYAPPRDLSQILHAVAFSLQDQHPLDASVVRRMILRHGEPKWQSHRDLFALLQSYLLGLLKDSLFDDLVLLLDEFCRHEQHIDRGKGEEYPGEIVNYQAAGNGPS